VINSIAGHYEEAVKWRRQLHRNPQPAWLEFYSTGFVAEKLAAWGYDLLLGSNAVAADQSLILPDPGKMEAEYHVEQVRTPSSWSSALAYALSDTDTERADVKTG